jgi:hypothetical protein
LVVRKAEGRHGLRCNVRQRTYLRRRCSDSGCDHGRVLARFGYVSVALYMIAMAVITVVAVYLATKTYRRDPYREEVEGSAATGTGATISS